MRLHSRWSPLVIVLLAAIAIACNDSSASTTPPAAATPAAAPAAEPQQGRERATEIRREAPAEPEPEPIDDLDLYMPVDVEEAVRPLRFEIFSEFGYENEEGELILDVMERDILYLTLMIQDAKGRPVEGVLPEVETERDSRFLPITGKDARSDDLGSYSFGVMGGSMGEELLEIAVGENRQRATLNVISLRAAGFGWLTEIEGVLDWSLLFKAEVTWDEEQITATFPDAILAKNDQTVRLAGFMVPLQTAAKQSHFVLASNPPGCFFHIPGGPAGAIEVFSKKPLEMSFEPVILEGRFEAHEQNKLGVVYQLHDAKLVDRPRQGGG